MSRAIPPRTKHSRPTNARISTSKGAISTRHTRTTSTTLPCSTATLSAQRFTTEGTGACTPKVCQWAVCVCRSARISPASHKARISCARAQHPCGAQRRQLSSLTDIQRRRLVQHCDCGERDLRLRHGRLCSRARHRLPVHGAALVVLRSHAHQVYQ